MTTGRRLHHLEDGLPPKEAVLLWLTEAHAHGSSVAYAAWLVDRPFAESPLVRLHEQAVHEVRRRLAGGSVWQRLDAEEQADLDIAFLFELVMTLETLRRRDVPPRRPPLRDALLGGAGHQRGAPPARRTPSRVPPGRPSPSARGVAGGGGGLPRRPRRPGRGPPAIGGPLPRRSCRAVPRHSGALAAPAAWRSTTSPTSLRRSDRPWKPSSTPAGSRRSPNTSSAGPGCGPWTSAETARALWRSSSPRCGSSSYRRPIAGFRRPNGRWSTRVRWIALLTPSRSCGRRRSGPSVVSSYSGRYASCRSSLPTTFPRSSSTSHGPTWTPTPTDRRPLRSGAGRAP